MVASIFLYDVLTDHKAFRASSVQRAAAVRHSAVAGRGDLWSLPLAPTLLAHTGACPAQNGQQRAPARQDGSGLHELGKWCEIWVGI